MAQPAELRAITGVADDPLLAAGRSLLRFTTALVTLDGDGLAAARSELYEDVGAPGVVRAAAVAGNFEMMNRLVDATGVPIGASMRAIADDLGLAGVPTKGGSE